MDEILHHLGALNYCNSWDFRDLGWCKISSINSTRSFGKRSCSSGLRPPCEAECGILRLSADTCKYCPVQYESRGSVVDPPGVRLLGSSFLGQG